MKTKRVLIAPLNWGLGHATRCIPVILEFLKQGAEVFIASDGRSLELLKKEFPKLTFFELKGYDIQYPENGSMKVRFYENVKGIAPGQSAVFYEGDDVLGGGIIQSGFLNK